MAEAEFKKDLGAFLSMANYPLVKHTDMTAETRDSAIDICMSAVEKFAADLEKCTQVIKDSMDKKFGSPWHVIVGKYFSYEITSEARHVLHLLVGGTTGVLLWKL